MRLASVLISRVLLMVCGKGRDHEYLACYTQGSSNICIHDVMALQYNSNMHWTCKLF